jgi:hypothetical protein
MILLGFWYPFCLQFYPRVRLLKLSVLQGLVAQTPHATKAQLQELQTQIEAFLLAKKLTSAASTAAATTASNGGGKSGAARQGARSAQETTVDDLVEKARPGIKLGGKC